MDIYIDEAGTFVLPSSNSNYISCVVALIIPSEKKQFLFDWFLQLRTGWGSKSDEIKGSAMDENQVRKVIEILGKYDCIVEIFAIDGSAHTADEITGFRLKQADRLMANIGPDHHPEMVKSMQERQEQLRKMPNQLFVESFLLTILCDQVLRTATLFWSQRAPKELGEFAWTVDAKDKAITTAEDMWRTLLMPFLETQSFSQPFPTVDDPKFDYSYFEKFFVAEENEAWKEHISWLKEAHGVGREKPFKGLDIRAIYKNLKFANSQDEVGLQLADVVASAFHRACKGTLQKEGWKDLGTLFISTRGPILHMVALDSDSKRSGMEIPITNPNVEDVLVTIRNRSRSMITGSADRESER